MRLCVLSVAYPFAPVGPDAVGGAEQVLSRLDHALVRTGHESIVVACEGSTVAGVLLETPAVEGVLGEKTRERVRRAHRERIIQALDEYPVDLIHLHGVDFDTYLPPEGWPALVTLHLPPSWYSPRVFDLERRGTHLHCVSASQRGACPPGVELLPEIENGVPMERLEPQWSRKEYALAMGRICPEKNFHVALEAGSAAGVPVWLAGQVFGYEEHLAYFRREIAPRLNRLHRFLGPIGGEYKRRVLAEARCLLAPSRAPETSSLVAMEAMACGTPVIAYPSGALGEIVEHGVTGYLVRDVKEMAEAIGAVDELDRGVCRAEAKRRFSLERMIEKYFAAYRMLAGGARAARGIEVEEVTTAEELERLGPEWAELWGRVPTTTPFQSAQWLIPWWRHIGQGALWTLAFRERGRLIGLIPLYIYTRPGTGRREVFPVGISTSDYLDGLILPQYEGKVLERLAEHLNRERGRWDVCDWPQLQEKSLLRRMRVPAGWIEEAGESEASLVLPLAGVPGRMMQKVRYYRRRAEGAGGMQIEEANEASFGECFDAWLQLHRARWARRGGTGVLDEPGVERFHREAARGLLSARMLRMYAGRMDGRMVAVLYAITEARKAGGRFYYYLGGFDPDYERFSPGTLLIGHAVEQAAGEGMGEFDFLRGCESYKSLWGAKPVATYRRRMRHAG